MKQPGLIDCVMRDVVLDYGIAKVNYTTSEYVPLVKNEDGVLTRGIFNYINVAGIMLYLYDITRPDIAL